MLGRLSYCFGNVGRLFFCRSADGLLVAFLVVGGDVASSPKGALGAVLPTWHRGDDIFINGGHHSA